MGCVPIAELSLQSSESVPLGSTLVPNHQSPPSVGSSDATRAVSLRVPSLRNTARQPYDPQEVVCQVRTSAATVQPQTPKNELASDGLRAVSPLLEGQGNLGGISEVVGVFDGPSSGVSALVNLVRWGLVTLQAVENDPPEKRTRELPNSGEPSSAAVLSSPASTPKSPLEIYQSPQRLPHEALNSPIEETAEPGSSSGVARVPSGPPISLPRIRVWLTSAAFEDAPTDPCDEQRDPLMHSLFRWVRPDLDQMVDSRVLEPPSVLRGRNTGRLYPLRRGANKWGGRGG